MGFVVLRPNIETVKPLLKLNQAIVYGKAFFMWQVKIRTKLNYDSLKSTSEYYYCILKSCCYIMLSVYYAY